MESIKIIPHKKWLLSYDVFSFYAYNDRDNTKQTIAILKLSDNSIHTVICKPKQKDLTQNWIVVTGTIDLTDNNSDAIVNITLLDDDLEKIHTKNLLIKQTI